MIYNKFLQTEVYTGIILVLYWTALPRQVSN